MSPVQPPSHDEIEAVTPIISGLITLAKWTAGPAAAAYVAGKFLLKSGVQAGEAKRKYTELSEAVEAIKAREQTYITVKQHDAMQLICTANISHAIDNRTNSAVAELRAEMSIMNGNICKIMGSLGIQDDGAQGRQRRGTDFGGTL